MVMLTSQIDLTTDHIDYSLLQRVLSPYSSAGTDYLKSMQLLHTWQSTSHSEGDPIVTSCGDYQIPTSCYIKDTGHFNAVEFLICYNQLAYATFAHLFDGAHFKDPSFNNVSPKNSEALASVTIDHYFKYQLSSMLILKTSTRFKNIINAKNFHGTLSIKKFKQRRGTLFIETECVFRDENGGYAEGEVLLAYHPKFN